MRTLFRLVVVLPVALIFLAFAVANRHWVTVSLDPFPGNDIAAPSLELPLFAVMVVCGMLGVLAGGVLVWFRQGRYRRQLRAARAEAEEARAQAAEARGQANDLRDRVDALGKAAALPAPRKDAA
ncbi:MAG: DUF1049 domain-containing protein [Hyphomicrobiales bacterium]|nr:DUF1049 domain-containing protein [Hyphomicrobiales bacterium]